MRKAKVDLRGLSQNLNHVYPAWSSTCVKFRKIKRISRPLAFFQKTTQTTLLHLPVHNHYKNQFIPVQNQLKQFYEVPFYRGWSLLNEVLFVSLSYWVCSLSFLSVQIIRQVERKNNNYSFAIHIPFDFPGCPFVMTNCVKYL